ncbi:MAG: hypothetical protein CVU44_20490 [Chloroflexi bacterium HGW-Chloroflexi-6]|nr:MAG: hypothetical protein CVU44_20490 [Chloroflexi bacterium HGW-Chloroflexi-6]
MRSQWIEHKGKKLLLINVANLTHDYDTLKNELEALIVLLSAEPKNSVLAVADLRGTHLNNNALLTLMSNAPMAAPYFRKSALVIESNYARRIILDSLGQFVGHLPKRFEHLDEAKDWLASEEA